MRPLALLLLLPALATAQPADDGAALVERLIAVERLDETAVAVARTDRASAASPGERGALGDLVREAFAEDLRPELLREALVVLEGPAYAEVQAAEQAWTQRVGVAELMEMMTAPLPPDVPTADSALVAEYVGAMREATQPADVRRATFLEALLALPDTARALLVSSGVVRQLVDTDAGGEEAQRRTVRVSRRQFADVDPAALRTLMAYYRSDAGRYVGRQRAIATGRLTLPMITASLAETADRITARRAAAAAAEADAADPPEAEIDVDEQPQILGGLRGLQTRVDYPVEARRRGIQGQVIVQMTVAVDGRPQDAFVLRSVHPLLDAAALAAVRESRFRPATRDGEPVAVPFAVPVTFRLR